MKNLIYAGVIGVCLILAVVVFVKTRGGEAGSALSDTEMTWVKCLKCGQGYEMGMKQHYDEVREKAKANTSGLPVTLPIACKQCGKDGIVRAFKCEKCSEIFRAGSVPGDYEDRCPKCKHSAIEAKGKARQQG